MKHFNWIRGLCLFAIAAVGLAAIVATSPPLPRNTLNLDNHRSGWRDICPVEEVSISWEVLEGENPRLNAIPANTTRPELDNYPIKKSGSLRLEVLSETTVRLETSLPEASRGKDSIYFREAPAELCAQFETSPFGTYLGRFDQEAPDDSSYSLGFWLEMRDDELYGIIYKPDDTAYGAKIALTCALDGAEFVCEGDNSTSVMTGQLAEGVYEGTYTDFTNPDIRLSAGTFTLTKQQP